ncbi:uncharacterized protein ACWYII_021960 [Salvelinus alpinus]
MGSVPLPSNEKDLLVELSFDGGLSMRFLGNHTTTVLLRRNGRCQFPSSSQRATSLSLQYCQSPSSSVESNISVSTILSVSLKQCQRATSLSLQYCQSPSSSVREQHLSLQYCQSPSSSVREQHLCLYNSVSLPQAVSESNISVSTILSVSLKQCQRATSLSLQYCQSPSSSQRATSLSLQYCQSPSSSLSLQYFCLYNTVSLPQAVSESNISVSARQQLDSLISLSLPVNNWTPSYLRLCPSTGLPHISVSTRQLDSLISLSLPVNNWTPSYLCLCPSTTGLPHISVSARQLDSLISLSLPVNNWTPSYLCLCLSTTGLPHISVSARQQLDSLISLSLPVNWTPSYLCLCLSTTGLPHISVSARQQLDSFISLSLPFPCVNSWTARSDSLWDLIRPLRETLYTLPRHPRLSPIPLEPGGGVGVDGGSGPYHSAPLMKSQAALTESQAENDALKTARNEMGVTMPGTELWNSTSDRQRQQAIHPRWAISRTTDSCQVDFYF